VRVLICGDRNWTNPTPIQSFLSTLPPGSTIITGGCRGADKIAEELATDMGIPVSTYPADWSQHGRAAGPIRNLRMLTQGKPDLVVAFHDNLEHSKGTKNMLKQATEKGVPTKLLTSNLK